MTIALALAAAAVAWAADSSSFTNRDANAKAAVDAADAGARVAAYRLSQHQPAPTEPVNTPAGAGGLCAMDGPESLGNGATFEYWISRALGVGDTCIGPTVDSTQFDVSQRCITAIGTVNGVSERIQERVAQYTSTPVFQAAIFGTKTVTIGNNETIVSDTTNSAALIGTNGVLTAGGTGGGNTVIDGYSLPPGASLQIGSNVTNNGPTAGRTTPYPIPQVTMGGTFNNTLTGGTCVTPSPKPVGYIQTNCDYRLSPTCLLSCDSISGSVSFDPVGRTLYLGNNSSVVLGGGYYNFCSLYLSNNSAITIAPGAQTSIYIDSPLDGGSTSPCSSSNSAQGVAPGTFTMSQNSTLNAGGSALNAQIYVYGDQTNTPPTNSVNLTNNGSSSFGLDAPFSNVNLSPSNNTIFRGAINGYTVTIGNAGHFTYEADLASLQNPALYAYYRSYWEQCAGPGSQTDPVTGC
jgi:hypothetical protein